MLKRNNQRTKTNISHIVKRNKSLTVPCSTHLTLLFFSSGCSFSCCLLGACTACWKTIGFPPGCRFFNHLGWPGLQNTKLVCFSFCIRHCIGFLGVGQDNCMAAFRLPCFCLLLHPTRLSGSISCTVLMPWLCSSVFMCILLRRAAPFRRRQHWKNTFIHLNTTKNYWSEAATCIAEGMFWNDSENSIYLHCSCVLEMQTSHPWICVDLCVNSTYSVDLLYTYGLSEQFGRNLSLGMLGSALNIPGIVSCTYALWRGCRSTYM